MKSTPSFYRDVEFDTDFLENLESTFRQGFINSVRKHRDENFIVCYEPDRIERTFGQFYFDVRRVASHLLHDKESHAQLIVLISENSYSMAVFIVAVLFAGFRLSLLNPKENYLMTEVSLKRLKQPYKVFVGDANSELTQLGESMDLKSLSANIEDQLPRAFNSDDFIYVPTSGSTGEFKFVRLSQNALLANIEALIQHHHLKQRKRIGTPLPLYHVNALNFSFFSSLLSGGSVVIWKQFLSKGTSEQIRNEKVQILSLTPDILRRILMQENRIFSFKDFESIDYFVSAAAPLSVEITAAFWKKMHKKIIQGYGLSEAVNFSCTLPINISDEDYAEFMIQSSYPSIGPSLWGNDIDIIDDSGEVVQRELVTGELHVRGWNVMKGYLNEVELADQKLRLFPTGDLGFFRWKGAQKFFFISGRKKDTAKIGGETIGLRDIDDFILETVVDNFDCISISFLNIGRGEEIGLVCSGPPESWDTTLDRARQLPLYRRPKIIFGFSNMRLRTESGKPLRWKFQKLFRPYKDVKFGGEVILVKELVGKL